MAAQTPEAPPKPGPPHHKPQDKAGKAAATKSSPQTPPAQSPAQRKYRNNGRELDLAYGAYQRGFFLTAFGLATERVDKKGDPKAMTLIGELYAGGFAVPQNDAKAAEVVPARCRPRRPRGDVCTGDVPTTWPRRPA